MTAMGMPDNKTQSAMRDHSGNEIVMEGKSGSEDIRVNATKDTNVVVTHDYNETVKTGNRTIAVQSGTHTETIKGNTSVTVTTGTYTHNVAANTADRVSKQGSSLVSTAAHVFIQAATNIQLHVGQSMIWMDSGGQIRIQGVNVSIAGSSTVTIKGGIVHSEADSEHQTKGAIVLSDGSATNTVRGGMVMLNP
jgi:type VI secretion system secreted protein VgrG